jgi:hypothetical protein
MTPEDELWALVEAARVSSAGSEEAFRDELMLRLATRSLDPIRRFDAARTALDRRLAAVTVEGTDLHTVVYEAWGGCSDDSFLDFRSSVVANGRDFYERMVADPVATLAEPPPTFGWRFEAALFGPLYDLEQRLGVPVFGEGSWDDPEARRLASELVAGWHDPTGRARMSQILVQGPS